MTIGRELEGVRLSVLVAGTLLVVARVFFLQINDLLIGTRFRDPLASEVYKVDNFVHLSEIHRRGYDS